LIAPLAKLAVSNASLRSLRCSLGSRRLRRIDETIVSQISSVLEAFHRLLLQTGGANIAGADRAWQPPTSSSFGEGKRVSSLLLSAAARDPDS
jgi:hypothetical protein